MKIFKSISQIIFAGVLWASNTSLWGLETAMMVKDAQISRQDTDKNQMEFAVVMTSKQLTPIEFNYITSDGTATAGKDYLSSSGKGIIPLGEKKTVIKIPIIQSHEKRKSSKQFFLSITSSQITVFDGNATGTIIDNGSSDKPSNQIFSNESVKKDKQ